ncbi:MAG: hypothetical protein HYY16_19945 [Planctomycetes bacterium]|nr:hypothetical protein [Planctomycetota bacterium]
MECVAFFPDGQRVAAGGSGINDFAIRVWTVSSGEARAVTRGEPEGTSVYALAFSPDGKVFASGWGELDQRIIIWDGAGCAEQQAIHVKSHTLSLAFAPDGKSLASVHRDEIRVWDPSSGKVVQTVRASAKAVRFAPDGKTLATADESGAVRLWDPQTGNLRGKLSASKSGLRAVTYTPDGERVIAGGEDKRAYVWECRTQKLLFRLTASDVIRSLAVSPNGDILAWSSADGTVSTWKLR